MVKTAPPIICEVYDKMCEDGIVVTKIVMGSEPYAHFMLNKEGLDRQEDGRFAGGIPVELGYFEDGCLLWIERETFLHNKDEQMDILDSIIQSELNRIDQEEAEWNQAI